jgi:U32 family peptidase
MTYIIAPAQNITTLEQIFDAGAEMAFAGLSGFCRNESESVDLATMKEMAARADHHDLKMVAALNRILPPAKTGKFIKTVEKVLNAGVHGLILNDPGYISAVRRAFPGAYVMASVGMSPVNFLEVEFLADAGADTVLLSEFLSLEEISEIRKLTKAGLEIFAKGLREFGYTGRCILSSYHHQKCDGENFLGSGKRGGNCSQICRTPFSAKENGKTLIKQKKAFPLSEFFLGKEIENLIPLVDIFKIKKGSLKNVEYLNIIRQISERVKKY